MPHRTVWLALACLLVLGLPAAAQELADANTARHPRFLLAKGTTTVPVDVAGTPVLMQRLALDLDGVSLRDALKAITSRTRLRLVYNDDVVPLETRVHLKADDIAVGPALMDLLLDTGIDVVFHPDGHAVLVKRTAGEAPLQTGTIVGRVTDAKTQSALAGATVVVEGTRLGATTGSDGRYRVAQVPAGTYTVRARYIGYAPGTASVSVTAEQEATTDFGLVKSAQRLDEVVTTGTVIPTEVKALPTPVSVITATDIERQQVRRTDQLIRQLVPGALAWEVGTIPAQSVVSVRGASTLDAGSGTLKVYIDGIEQASTTLAAIDPSTIERIEVIRGPEAAAIYGSDAIGGVMQVFTKHGDPAIPRPQVAVQTALGAVQSDFPGSGALRQQYTLSVTGGTPAASYNLGAGYTHTADWVPNFSVSAPSAAGGLRVTQGKLSLGLSGRYYQQSYGEAFDPRLVQTGVASLTRPIDEDHQTREETYGATLTYVPTPWWQHTLTAGIDRFVFDTHQNRPQLTAPADTFLFLDVSNRRKTSLAYNTTVRARLTRAALMTVTAGFDHYTYALDGFTTFGAMTTTGSITNDPANPPQVRREVTQNTGYFAQVQLNLKERLFLTGAVRADENSNFGEALGTPVSPRFGISYVHPLGPVTLKVRGSYGEAIRAPALGKNTASSTPFDIQLANPLLGPERQKGGDGGADLVFGERASVSVTYYNQTAHDLIQSVLVDAAAVPVYQSQNVGRVKNSGWEVEGTLRLDRVQLSGQYAYTRSRVEDLGPNYTGDLQVGDQVLLVPRHTAGGSLTVTPFGGTSVTAGLAYVGKRTFYNYVALFECIGGTGPCHDSFRDFQTPYPAFVKANLTVTQALSRDVSGFIAVENVGNNTAAELVDYIPVPGRTTMVGFRATLK
jgi:outer membrane receptor protein involved in Fe transport